MKLKKKKTTKNLIYIHGFSANKNDHPILKQHVESCGYNFYSFDLLAHGKNKNKQDIKDVKFDTLVHYCVIKIKELKLDNFVLFGHSMGGAIVSVIAGSKYFKKELQGIILESPHNKKALLRSKFAIDSAINIIKETRLADDKEPSVTAYLTELKKKKEYLPLLLNILRPTTLAKIQGGIKNINVKTLLLVANKDIYIPYRDTRENYSENVDDLEVHVIKGAGHCISIDKPNDFYKYFDNFLLEIANKNG